MSLPRSEDVFNLNQAKEGNLQLKARLTANELVQLRFRNASTHSLLDPLKHADTPFVLTHLVYLHIEKLYNATVSLQSKSTEKNGVIANELLTTLLPEDFIHDISSKKLHGGGRQIEFKKFENLCTSVKSILSELKKIIIERDFKASDLPNYSGTVNNIHEGNNNNIARKPGSGPSLF